jgi:hypothetical protein
MISRLLPPDQVYRQVQAVKLAILTQVEEAWE